MTHDTPGDTADRRRWCADCRLAVEPLTDGDGPRCPACDARLRPR